MSPQKGLEKKKAVIVSLFERFNLIVTRSKAVLVCMGASIFAACVRSFSILLHIQKLSST